MEENSQSMLLCDMAQAQSKKETYLEEVMWKKTIGDPQKSFTLLVFSRFCGSGAGKRDAKIIRCFWKSILDLFLNNLWTIFCCAPEEKNRIIECFLSFFASRSYILQNGENCANTSVFARRWPTKKVNTVIFATRGKNMS